MKHTWINNTNSDALILFFNGWACDSEPFQFLECGTSDVLMCYDYASLLIEPNLVDTIKNYKQVKVVAWSFGVWVAQYILENLQIVPECAIAFNGTLSPIDETQGIPKAIADGTLDRMSERNLSKFQRRMCGGGDVWEQFQNHPPKRHFDEQKQELASLYAHFKGYSLSGNYFDKALIADGDMIFPSQSQLAFWEGKSEIELLEASHFCFNIYTRWEQLFS